MTKPTHGGTRPNAGRKAPYTHGKTLRYTVTLDQASAIKLAAFGGGNLSVGIRKAAAQIKQA